MPKKKLSQSDLQDIINLYSSGVSPKNIALKYNIHAATVIKKLRQNGIERNQSKRLNEEQKQYIIEKYKSGISSEVIARDLGINGTTACKVLKNAGIKIRPATINKRKNDINENWLNTIDSQEKAYFLGFMYTDGCVDAKKNSIQIALHKQDVDILEKFSEIFYNKNVVKSYKNNVVKFSIFNENIKNKLISYGCTPRKTFTIKYPDCISENLNRHFIRGLIDGDGCIYIGEKYNKFVIDFTGTIELINSIKEITNKFLDKNIEFYIYKRHKDRNDNIYSFRIQKKSNVIKFLDWIYDGSIIHLNRKYQKYLQIKSDFISKQKIPKGYGTNYIIKYKENHLTKTYINSIDVSKRQEIAEFLLSYFRSYGFPFPQYDDDELLNDFNKLKNLNTDKICNDGFILNNTSLNYGLKLFKHFCHHYFSVKVDNKKTYLEVFNNDELLKKVINNRLGITYKETFSITGNMLRQGMRNSFLVGAASIFKPVIAKYIYDKYTPQNGIVYDYASGFGQRMLGAMSANKNIRYIGVDPWEETISKIQEMSEFINCEQFIELHNVGAESFCPKELQGKIDLAFSSPPYFNIEKYDGDNPLQAYNRSYDLFINEWFQSVAKNIYSLLKENGFMILNMKQSILNDMHSVLLSTGFIYSDTIYIKSSRKKMHKDHVNEPIAIYIKK